MKMRYMIAAMTLVSANGFAAELTTPAAITGLDGVQASAMSQQELSQAEGRGLLACQWGCTSTRTFTTTAGGHDGDSLAMPSLSTTTLYVSY